MSWLAPTLSQLRGNARKATDVGAFAPIAVNTDRVVGTIAGYADEDAVFALSKAIGTTRVHVNVNGRASKCSVLQCWHGDPMPDPDATYVTVRVDDASLDAIGKGASVSVEVK